MPTNTRGIGWLTEAVATEIRSLMGRQGMLQVELAELSGIPKATVSSLVKAGSAIDLEQLARMSKALKIEPDELLRTAIQEARKAGTAPAPAHSISADGETNPELVEGRDYEIGTPSPQQLAALTPEKIAELLRRAESPD
ncbi:helix-turn-helix domain-containing protein [Nocardia sp. N2S4-5]|uniref:helix-turn-helix domain-containing protein n=1 Tax=Nocardia sp. N2S4-5 TaxID=3351565 RepID=UPI0037D68A6F